MTDRSAAGSRLLLLASAALFSTGGAAIKACQLAPFQIACLRSAVATVAVLAMVPAARQGWGWRTFGVGIAYAATLNLFVQANKLTTATNAIFLQSTAPLYVLLLSPFLLKERITRRDLIFIAAVASGLAMFFIGEEAPRATAPHPVLGNILALCSGVAWAFTVIGLRWLGSGATSTAITTVGAGNLMASLVALPGALPFPSISFTDAAVILYLGVFQIGLAYYCFTSGIRRVPALEASTLLLLEPTLNPVWTWLFHGEQPGAWAVAGSLTILAATLLKTWWSARSTVGVEPPVHVD